MVSNEKHVCCICKKIFNGEGNNPDPVENKGRCCNDCNAKYVIAARIGMLGIIPSKDEIKKSADIAREAVAMSGCLIAKTKK
jgi:1-deoxy-D-xylulose 5-phosphate reductoisomerase